VLGMATFPDGTTVTLLPNKDPREVLANWLPGTAPYLTTTT
jgi:hypothetical protein